VEALDRDPHRVGGDLREDGLDPLTDGGDPDVRDEAAVWLGRDARLLEDAGVAHLHEAGDADPDRLAVSAAALGLRAEARVVEALEQRVEGLGVVALGVEGGPAAVDIRDP
jgi:hypothetical protein